MRLGVKRTHLYQQAPFSSEKSASTSVHGMLCSSCGTILAAHAEHPDQPCAFAQVDGYASVAKELRSRAMAVESRGPDMWPLLGAAKTARAFIAIHG